MKAVYDKDVDVLLTKLKNNKPSMVGVLEKGLLCILIKINLLWKLRY